MVRTAIGEQWELGPCRKVLRHNPLDFQYDFTGNKSVESCIGYVFDHSQVEQSIVTEWDLVCEKEWLAKLSQPTFMLGVLIGALVFGDIADRYGIDLEANHSSLMHYSTSLSLPLWSLYLNPHI